MQPRAATAVQERVRVVDGKAKYTIAVLPGDGQVWFVSLMFQPNVEDFIQKKWTGKRGSINLHGQESRDPINLRGQ